VLLYYYRLQLSFKIILIASKKKEEMGLIVKKKEQGAALPTLHCSLCDAALFSKGEIRGHLLSAHLDVYEQIKNSANADVDEEPQKRCKWKCEECKLGVDSEQLFFSHVKSEHPTTPFYCTISSCRHLFASLISLRDHHRKEHYHSKFNIPLMDDDGSESHFELVKECESGNENLCHLKVHILNQNVL